jgi:hypothetical protein
MMYLSWPNITSYAISSSEIDTYYTRRSGSDYTKANVLDFAFSEESVSDWHVVTDICLSKYAELGKSNVLGLGPTINSRLLQEYTLLATLSGMDVKQVGEMNDGKFERYDPESLSLDSPA